MNAIVLAAGKGERLHPLTEKKPKCLIELFGKSLLQWQIDTFQAFGINDITVISGYKSEQIQTLNIDTVKNEKGKVQNFGTQIGFLPYKLDHKFLKINPVSIK